MTIAQQLLQWYDQNGRSNLPWRQHITPYKVWLSEIMLQQTQVTTVIPYYNRFMQRFPSLEALAKANEDEVMHYWSGLGYYARARNLQRTASIIYHDYHGYFPARFEQLVQLPGIGQSTAGAILAIAFNQKHAILDGNVKRILSRLYAIYGWSGRRSVENKLWHASNELLPDERINDYTQAIMDLGSLICVKRQPLCDQCPINEHCLAYQQGLTDILPESKPATKRPVKYINFYIMINQANELLLEKLPPIGVWGGLWCFPYIKTNEADSLLQIESSYDLTINEWHQLDQVKHAFSHYQLIAQPYVLYCTSQNNNVGDNAQRIWYNPQYNQTIGLPKLINKLIQQVRQS